jgi:peptidoglycan/LPS O-acetylase OafA/YrhL
VAMSVLALGIVLLVSIASYRLVERPFLRLKRSFRQARIEFQATAL